MKPNSRPKHHHIRSVYKVYLDMNVMPCCFYCKKVFKISFFKLFKYFGLVESIPLLNLLLKNEQFKVFKKERYCYVWNSAERRR